MSKKSITEMGNGKDRRTIVISVMLLFVLFLFAGIVPILGLLFFEFAFIRFENRASLWVWLRSVPEMLTPEMLSIQAPALLFTYMTLIIFIFVWPRRFDEKAWCIGVLFMLHAVLGSYLILSVNLAS